MSFAAPPATAAWQHREARSGFEVAYFDLLEHGCRIEGCTTAVEDGQTWAVDYAITLDRAWVTRSARVSSRSASKSHSTQLDADGTGKWWIDGESAPHLDGCLDVDLESSAFTNALPVHRKKLRVGERTAAPAAYVRALSLAVERLEQTYLRADDDGAHQRFDYTAPAFEFACQLVYDPSGLVLDYPGIATRVH